MRVYIYIYIYIYLHSGETNGGATDEGCAQQTYAEAVLKHVECLICPSGYQWSLSLSYCVY